MDYFSFMATAIKSLTEKGFVAVLSYNGYLWRKGDTYIKLPHDLSTAAQKLAIAGGALHLLKTADISGQSLTSKLDTLLEGE